MDTVQNNSVVKVKGQAIKICLGGILYPDHPEYEIPFMR